MSDISAVTTTLLLDELPVPVYLKNRQNVFLYANAAFVDLMGVCKDEIIGKFVEDFADPLIAVKSAHTDEALLDEIQKKEPLDENLVKEFVLTLTKKDKSELIIQAKKRLINLPGIGECIMCILNDISQFIFYEKELEEKHRELRRQQSKLKELASLDPLTGIFNRRAFYDKAKEIIDYAKVGDLDVGVLMFDLDQFKKLNDTHGHAAGDEVLLRFTRVVSDCCRTSDIFARLGGEEFALLLPDTSEAATRQIAERIRKSVEANTVVINDKTIKYTTSVGATMWAVHEDKIDRTLSRADRYLYQAKEAGRNRVQFILADDENAEDRASVA